MRRILWFSSKHSLRMGCYGVDELDVLVNHHYHQPPMSPLTDETSPSPESVDSTPLWTKFVSCINQSSVSLGVSRRWIFQILQIKKDQTIGTKAISGGATSVLERAFEKSMNPVGRLRDMISCRNRLIWDTATTPAANGTAKTMFGRLVRIASAHSGTIPDRVLPGPTLDPKTAIDQNRERERCPDAIAHATAAYLAGTGYRCSIRSKWWVQVTNIKCRGMARMDGYGSRCDDDGSSGQSI
ncbi:hypothetical protein QBC35DRAFT_470612 [Podospora australis]|uniref:Uncharacterized protein n=1 Tax=Podospora australis TaxID=1536484 RepID=A0AAN7AN70_9PEZI|nr:hypothetical protein QBC35DRAFT_470612 [Podospora australis]